MIKLKTLLILAFVSISLTISFEAKAQEDDWDDPWDMEEDGVDIIAECLYCDYCCGGGCSVCNDDPFLWDDPFEEDMCMLSCGCCGSCCECDPSLCIEEEADEGEEEICDMPCGCCGSCCDCDPSLCKEEEPDEKPTYDCAGVKNGNAYVDACGDCVGGNTGAITCDPCEEEMNNLANNDIANCKARKSAENLSSEHNCDNSVLEQNYNEAYDKALQEKYAANIGKAEVQSQGEMRCAPLSIQYIGCASQEEVMTEYIEHTGTSLSPCDHKTSANPSGINFPGINSESEIKRVVSDYIDVATESYMLNTEQKVKEFYADLDFSSSEKYIVATRTSFAHVFVVTGKGAEGTGIVYHYNPTQMRCDIQGYDPSVGENITLDPTYFIGAEIVVFKINDCNYKVYEIYFNIICITY